MSVQAGMAAGATIAVALRFYTRLIVTHNVGYDDWYMLGALVGFLSWISSFLFMYLPLVQVLLILRVTLDILMGSQWSRVGFSSLRNGQTYRHD